MKGFRRAQASHKYFSFFIGPLGSLRAFNAWLLSALILVAPIVPLSATSNREVSRRQITNTRHERESAPGREMQPHTLANSHHLTNPSNPLTGPSVTATLDDAFIDSNSSGRADPGSTVTYTAVIANNGGADATGVQFNETIDPNTMFVAGSLKISPLAFDDAYNVTGSTLNTSAPGVLGNDSTNSASISSYGVNGNEQTTIGTTTPTAQAGSISLNADGSFTYTKPGSFSGTDTFKYTLSNVAGNSTATVTFSVGCPTITVTNPSTTTGTAGTSFSQTFTQAGGVGKAFLVSAEYRQRIPR